MTDTERADAPSSRERLLALVADVILEHGVADLSLSRIARLIGSNNRMLLYYFGSKEELLNQATLAAFERFPRINGMLGRLRGEGPGDALDPAARLLRAWADISHPDNLPFLALFFEAYGIALHLPSANRGYFTRIAEAWVPEVEQMLAGAGVPADAARLRAVQVVSTWRGLQFALLAGTPRDALDAAYAAMIADIVR
ncbi:TetR/AcrR family transcriptional regulator [Frondihabitans australicus]|uniref:TetR family transcriptional regulator n=1 Tax=Frondihabitans australicus TaxID=386892 RepID=A0A495IDM0_9MICO|nr:TetR/AcrR family transcriptional regulator [Frondihabitans australicus]RKR73568.1 TetR family transcriptional regulator [Frondihabitans australicus]